MEWRAPEQQKSSKALKTGKETKETAAEDIKNRTECSSVRF